MVNNHFEIKSCFSIKIARDFYEEFFLTIVILEFQVE